MESVTQLIVSVITEFFRAITSAVVIKEVAYFSSAESFRTPNDTSDKAIVALWTTPRYETHFYYSGEMEN